MSAALGGFLFGYDTAVINGAVGAIGEVFAVSSDDLGRAVASALIGSALAISEEKDISLQDVKSLLLNLRSQRGWLVESSEQFRFAISILLANSQFNQSASIASPGNSDVLSVKGTHHEL